MSPEAVGVLGRPLDVSQATWSSRVNNRLLFEAGFGGTFFGVGNFEREPNPTLQIRSRHGGGARTSRSACRSRRRT